MELVVFLALDDYGVLVQRDLSKVIGSGYDVVVTVFVFDLTVGTIYCVDVGSVFSASPDFLNWEADYACPGEPVSVFECGASSGHLISSCNIPEQNLICLTITL